MPVFPPADARGERTPECAFANPENAHLQQCSKPQKTQLHLR